MEPVETVGFYVSHVTVWHHQIASAPGSASGPWLPDWRSEPRHPLLRVTADGSDASRNASEVWVGVPPLKPVLEPTGVDRKEVADSILIPELTSDSLLVQFTPSGPFHSLPSLSPFRGRG